MKVAYARKFLRSFRKLPSDIQDNFRKKEKLFRKEPFHFQLRTHKLKGREEWSFLITYSVRVLFFLIPRQLAARFQYRIPSPELALGF